MHSRNFGALFSSFSSFSCGQCCVPQSVAAVWRICFFKQGNRVFISELFNVYTAVCIHFSSLTALLFVPALSLTLSCCHGSLIIKQRIQSQFFWCTLFCVNVFSDHFYFYPSIQWVWSFHTWLHSKQILVKLYSSFSSTHSTHQGYLDIWTEVPLDSYLGSRENCRSKVD